MLVMSSLHMTGTPENLCLEQICLYTQKKKKWYHEYLWGICMKLCIKNIPKTIHDL